jgi:DNA-binding transcriptional LysR family regulator
MAAKTQQGSLRDFDWDDARVLLALARKRTLRGAAETLRVNASTIGRRLDALEGALATRLFERMQEGLLPTAAAEQLLAHAERLEQAALGLASAAEGFEREPEGVVRITAPPGVADHFIAPALPRLIARYPALRVELDSSIAYSDLARGEADLALRVLRPSAGDLVAVKVHEEPDAILGSAAYVRELGALRKWNDARWLCWGHDLALLPSTRWVSERVASERLVLRSSSIHALLGAAEAGLGLVLLSRSYAGVRPLLQAKLSAALAKETASLPTLELWLVGHRALREVPRVAVVWEFVLEEMKRRR